MGKNCVQTAEIGLIVGPVNEPVKTPWPSLEGLWSLLWRATLFAPFAGVLFAIYLAAWIGLFVVPVCVLQQIWLGEWPSAVLLLGGWMLLLTLFRWKRFRLDSRDILNEQENI